MVGFQLVEVHASAGSRLSQLELELKLELKSRLQPVFLPFRLKPGLQLLKKIDDTQWASQLSIDRWEYRLQVQRERPAEAGTPTQSIKR